MTQRVLFDKGFCLVRGALPLLGSAVGTDQSGVVLGPMKRSTLGKELVDGKERVARSAVVASHTLVPDCKPNFLARTLPPNLTQDIPRDFDEVALGAVEARTQ